MTTDNGTTFRHSVPVQLRFNDADSLGHVNNSVYFSFYDLGKTEYFRTILGKNYYGTKIDIVVAHAEVDFLQPVFLTDDIAVQTRISEMGHKSFKLQQRIVCLNTGAVKCVCTTVMVGFDFTTGATIPISSELRGLIADYESREDFR